ncbi:MAG: sigma-54 dependent transcriptional regulator [Granulicella sp.]
MKKIAALQQIGEEVPIALLIEDQPASALEEARSAGVTHFLMKPLEQGQVESLLSSLDERIRKAPTDLRNGTHPHVTRFSDGNFFLAGSPAMLEILRQIERIAPPDVPVLITGESGVGKEMVARMLHLRSRRAGKNLLKLNCAALPADLLESELFGYEAGAFTGAVKAKPGKFEQCDGGTILLDEIGEMSAALQAKLLHVLQDGSFSRLGSRVETKVNVRIIAATNIDMEQALSERRFREDLFYRLNAFVIEVPPLRERRVEIPYLLRDMTRALAATHQVEPIEFSSQLISAALEYQWPGNLRELCNFVKRHLIMRDESMALVDLQHKTSSRYLSLTRSSPSKSVDYSGGLKAASRCAKDEAETMMLRSVLEEANWNRRIAAERLQISYKALLYKIRQYRLDAPDAFVAHRNVEITTSVQNKLVAT